MEMLSILWKVRQGDQILNFIISSYDNVSCKIQGCYERKKKWSPSRVWPGRLRHLPERLGTENGIPGIGDSLCQGAGSGSNMACWRTQVDVLLECWSWGGWRGRGVGGAGRSRTEAEAFKQKTCNLKLHHTCIIISRDFHMNRQWPANTTGNPTWGQSRAKSARPWPGWQPPSRAP